MMNSKRALKTLVLTLLLTLCQSALAQNTTIKVFPKKKWWPGTDNNLGTTGQPIVFDDYNSAAELYKQWWGDNIGIKVSGGYSWGTTMPCTTSPLGAPCGSWSINGDQRYYWANVRFPQYGSDQNWIVASMQTVCPDSSWSQQNYDYRDPSIPGANSSTIRFCEKSIELPPDPAIDSKQCLTCPCPISDQQQDGLQVGNPILPATGEKIKRVTDFSLPGSDPIDFGRMYRSSRVSKLFDFGIPAVAASGNAAELGAGAALYNLFGTDETPLMGAGWSALNIPLARIGLPARSELPAAIADSTIIYLGDGRYRAFKPIGNDIWQSVSYSANDKFSAVHPDGKRSAASEYIFQGANSDDQWVFEHLPGENFAGTKANTVRLAYIRKPNGWKTSYEYALRGTGPENYPTRIVNQFGFHIDLKYDTHNQLTLATALTPDGAKIQETTYQYDPQFRLINVIQLNGDSEQYHYEDASNPLLLTGLSKNNQRLENYRYNATGQAVLTEKVNGAERYSITYGTGKAYRGVIPDVTVTDALGTARTYQYMRVGDRVMVRNASLPPNDPRIPSSMARGQAGLNMTQAANFKSISQYDTYDSNDGRGLPLSITEAYLRPEQRQTNFTWHPTLQIPTKIDESGGKHTVNTYDSQGNLIQQDITQDGDVSSSRTLKWTYNAIGLLETATDPRGGISTYTYGAQGQLNSSKNPRNHTTTYGYDTAGRVNRITQPNGLVQTMVYNPRGWVTSQTQTAGGVTLTSRYTYAPSGQVKTATLPNGHVITYQYDAAERLVGWSDNRGQSASYTLDAMGNATQQTVRNSGGQTALSINTEINAINRVQSQTVGNIIERQTQDANGNLASVADAANRTTTLGRDALDRVTTVTNAAAKTATLAYNAQDAVTAATDFKGVKTDFTRDAQSNAKTEASPDIGTTTALYNGLELPTRVVDAMGRASAITRDALNRPTKIVNTAAGAPTLTTLLTYDTAGTACNATGHTLASKGQLCTLIDQTTGTSGPFTQATTQYQWDSFGRLTRQTQTLSSAIASHSRVQTTAYSYVASGAGAGQLSSLTYPSGAVVSHLYSTTGRLSGLDLGGQPLLRDIVYNALEQPLSWTWSFATPANSLKATRAYNTAGQLTNAGFASFTPNNLGQIASLAQGLYKPTVASAPTGAQTLETVPFSAVYNAVGQLTSFSATAPAQPFQYTYTYSLDANGNRNGGSSTLGGTLSSYTSAVPATNNRPTTQAGINVVTNAAGDVTSLLGKTITYDAAGRVSEVTAVPPCPTGLNCSGSQTTLSRYNGHNQRYLRDNPAGQTVFTYAPDGYSVLAEVQHTLIGATTVSNTLENVYLPTASGPMPVVALINGAPFAVYADHLNTPRRLTDANGRPRWQWAFSGFGEQAALSIPAAGQPAVNYSLRYPGQVDDGNGLFYNFNRFYDPVAGRYTQADPIGLDGGWNRFGYVGGNALGTVDPEGLNPAAGCALGAWAGPAGCATGGLLGLGAALATGALLGGDASKPSRPDNMDRLEERAFDRYCNVPGGDPCSLLKAAVQEAIQNAKIKQVDMFIDNGRMFGTSGWLTHGFNLTGRINNILAMISLGEKMGCNMTLEKSLARELFVPHRPK